jgi:hypothetical protein
VLAHAARASQAKGVKRFIGRWIWHRSVAMSPLSGENLYLLAQVR